MRLYDTYFAMLERPELRQIGAGRIEIFHQTDEFSPEIYANSAKQSFATRDSAYLHWLTIGRRAGLEWAPGKDTLLKIILKAKDEPELIDIWVAHHAAIVGYHNLVIVDCGSTNPRYLERLKHYSSKLLVFSYRRYYDHLHTPTSNYDFFKLLSENAKFISILDADEFLIAGKAGLYSASFVKTTLQAGRAGFFCGSWLNASVRDGTSLDSSSAIACTISLDIDTLRNGTLAGKSIVRSDLVFEIGHLGHNLHSATTFRYVTEDSFKKIFVIHLKEISPEVTRERAVKHLAAKGVLVNVSRAELSDHIKKLACDTAYDAAVRGYARQYLGRKPELHVSGISSSEAALINTLQSQSLNDLERLLERFDIPALIRERGAYFSKVSAR